MASRKKAPKSKRVYAGERRRLSEFLKREEREVTKKFHGFLDAWKAHIHEEIAIHKKFVGGRRSLKQHVEDTVKIHKKFLKKLGSV
ncbi:MAG: hypothetical protein WC792_00920 [Candidatus Micrarchaeia archaeon]|jgi:hypothetical protein